ncbi:MAG: ABC transporter ATP-binding protein [Candidatus Diapherotrites archaeon]
MASTIKFMQDMLKEHKKELIIITSLATFASILSTAIPFLYGKLFDLAVKNTPLNLLLSLVLIWLITSLISNYTQNKASYFGNVLGAKITWEREAKTYGHFISLPVSFHKNKRTGEFLDKMSRAAWNINQLIVSSSNLMPQILVLIFSSIVVFLVQWQLALILVSVLLIYVLVTIKFTGPSMEAQEKMITIVNKQYGKVYDRLYNVFLIKNFAREEKEKYMFHNLLVTKASPSMKDSQKKWSKLALYQGMIHSISFVVLLVFAIFFLRKGDITGGQFIMFFGYTNLVFTPLWMLTEFYKNFKRSSVAIKKIIQFENFLPERMKHGDKTLKEVKGEIIFKDVNFAYKKDKEVLKNINFTIKAGESIALVGKSGVGKSTLSELILGYYKPRNGKIFLDKVDISEIKLQFLREQLAIVPQDLSLLNETLIDNIRYAKSNASYKEIVEASKAAGAHEFIMKFPKEYDTLIGERGIKLSMGQRQRIALTMAFLKNPRILILDEPTSALDAESEKIVHEGIKKLIKGRTTIIIAHRFSTVKNADKIIVLENGRVEEEGNHNELMRKKGIYYKLYQMQMGLD